MGLRARRVVGLLPCVVLLMSGPARAEDICGVVAATVFIAENSQLTCDVVCTNTTGPCIQFANDHIKLRLNGFTMTGPAEPPNNCAASPAFGPGNPGPFPFDGISTGGFDHVEILGPGMVQKFRRHGIFVFESEKATIKHVTSHDNCFSGLLLGLSDDNDVEGKRLRPQRQRVGRGALRWQLYYEQPQQPYPAQRIQRQRIGCSWRARRDTE